MDGTELPPSPLNAPAAMTSQRYIAFLRFLIRWEGSVNANPGEDVEATYRRAKPFAFSDHPADSGGATMMGVTYTLFALWRTKVCRQPQPSRDDLRAMQYREWEDIVRYVCWEPVRADLMPYDCFSIALADWYWHSGRVAVRKAQALINAQPDGIVGRKTIFAARRTMKTRDRARLVTSDLAEQRRQWLHDLADRRPKDRAFLRGWDNRIDALLALIPMLDLMPDE